MRNVSNAIFNRKTMSGGLQQCVSLGVNCRATMPIFDLTTDIDAVTLATYGAIITRTNDPFGADDDAPDR